MEGTGSYDDWGYYAPPQPHSTLSPYAAAFSVNRSAFNDGSAPFADSEESAYGVASTPIHYPVHPRSYGYDFFPESDSSSKPFGYSGLQSYDSQSAQFPDLNFKGLGSDDSLFPYEQWPPTSSKPSLGEAQPYFPSYTPSTIHSPTSSVAPPPHRNSLSGFASLDNPNPPFGDYAEMSPEFGFSGQGSGFWNQFSGFDHFKGKQVGVGSSFSSKHTIPVAEERMNQGCQDMKVSNNGVPHTVDEEKYSMPINSDQFVEKSFPWGTIKRPVQMSGASSLQSPPVPLVIHVPAPSESVADNGVPYTTDGEKHGMPINQDQFVDKSFPWGTIKRPVQNSGASSLQSPPAPLVIHVPGPSKSVVDSDKRHLSYTGPYDKHLIPRGRPIEVETCRPELIPGFATDLNIGNNVADGDLGLDNLYNIKDQMPCPGTATGCFDLDHLRMHLERNEPSSSNNAMISDNNVSRDVKDYDIFKVRHEFQNRLDNLCLRLSDIEDVNSGEKSFEGGDQCNPAVDSPCWKGAPADHISHYESCDVLPPEHVHKNEKPRNFLLDTESDVKRSPEHSNSRQMYSENVDLETRSSGSPLKCSVTKFASKNCKSDGAVNAGPFLSEPICICGHQYLDDITNTNENSMPLTKPADCESRSSLTEHQVIEEDKSMSQKQHTLCIGGGDAGCNVVKCLESCTSHTAEHAKSPSVVDAPSAPENSVGEVSTEKVNVQLLVDTMQNMSELLLYHCLNDACELKERDCNILKNVISNLNTCALKNAEEITPAPEGLFHQPENSGCTGAPYELQQNASFKRPQLTKIEQESSKIELENLFQEANQHFRSEKPHWKLPVCLSPGFAAETAKADNMTKELKRILSENFHDEEEEESQTDLYKNLWLEAEAALCAVSYKARYNRMKIEMEKHSYNHRVDMEEPSKAELTPSSNKSQSSATEVHNYPNPDSPAPDLPVLHDTNQKELSPLEYSTDMNKANPLTPEEDGSQDLINFIQNYISGTNNEAANDESSVMARYYVLKSRADNPCVNTADLEEPSDSAGKLSPGGDNQNQVNLGTICQDSPVSTENKAGDFDASVLARFHILRSRADDSSSVSSHEKLSDGVEFSVNRMYDSTITENASEGNSLDVDLNNSYTALNISMHPDLEDNDEVQPHHFQVPPTCCYSDGLASDWEHV